MGGLYYNRKIVVLRIGHRVGRDKRISTHVGLVARAFGANGIVFVGEVEESMIEKLKDVVERWGGPFFVERVSSWKEFIKRWKSQGGLVIHLTMYGVNIEGSDVIEALRKSRKDILVIVGAEKVPREVYELADYNIAIGNQPHSEVSALAIFLDRLFQGKELLKEFEKAKLKIIPCPRGKKVIRVGDTY